jgi:hypothetical protein
MGLSECNHGPPQTVARGYQNVNLYVAWGNEYGSSTVPYWPSTITATQGRTCIVHVVCMCVFHCVLGALCVCVDCVQVIVIASNEWYWAWGACDVARVSGQVYSTPTPPWEGSWHQDMYQDRFVSALPLWGGL